MKHILPLAFALAFTACASRPPKAIVITPASRRVADASTVRLPERVREYRFGRYVDPGDRSVMHDAHPVYRVEDSAAWNLRPSPGGARSNTAPPAASTPPEKDAALAELNKQRAATRAFTEQTTALNQRLAELAQAVGQTQEIAKQNLALKREIVSLRDRMDAFAQTPPSPQPRSAQPAAKPDDKW
jgi:hypothetical protein